MDFLFQNMVWQKRLLENQMEMKIEKVRKDKDLLRFGARIRNHEFNPDPQEVFQYFKKMILISVNIRNGKQI